MPKKVLFSLVAIVTSFGLFAACSDDSGTGSTQSEPDKTPAANLTYAKLDSCSFVTSGGSCGGEGGLMKTVSEVDSVHVVVNKDGSAVLKDRFGSICAENGEVSKISLDKREDTLWVHVEYREFPPDIRGGSKCECFADYEIDIPAEFVGVKYMTFNGNYLWNISYEQQ